MTYIVKPDKQQSFKHHWQLTCCFGFCCCLVVAIMFVIVTFAFDCSRGEDGSTPQLICQYFSYKVGTTEICGDGV